MIVRPSSLLLLIRPFVLFLVLVTTVTTSGCSDPSDEEVLKDRIDVLPTHIYAALKVVLVQPDRDPDVERTRELLDEAMARLDEAREGNEPGEVKLSPGDALALAKALWALRALGAEEVRRGRESDLPAVLGTLGEQSKLLASASRELDHGLLLLGLLLLKNHPKSPLPVSDSILLYEAWMAGEMPIAAEDADGSAGVVPIIRSAQAYVFSTGELCDLATHHTDALADVPLDASGDEIRDIFGSMMGLGRLAAHAPEAAHIVIAVILLKSLPWSSRLLAHATTGACLEGREEAERALREWERALDVATAVGFPEADLALLRAYLSYRAEDFEALPRHLKEGRNSHLLDERGRRDLDEIIEHFESESDHDRGLLSDFFDKVFMIRFITGMVHERLAAAGLYEALDRLPIVQKVHAVFGVFDRVPEPRGVWDAVTGWFDSLFEGEDS